MKICRASKLVPAGLIVLASVMPIPAHAAGAGPDVLLAQASGSRSGEPKATSRSERAPSPSRGPLEDLIRVMVSKKLSEPDRLEQAAALVPSVLEQLDTSARSFRDGSTAASYLLKAGLRADAQRLLLALVERMASAPADEERLLVLSGLPFPYWLAQLGLYKEAFQVLDIVERMAAQVPGDQRRVRMAIHMNRGNLFMQLGDNPSAIAQYEAVVATAEEPGTNPNLGGLKSNAQQLAAMLYQRSGQFGKARELLEKRPNPANQDRSDTIRAWSALSDTSELEGRRDLAIAYGIRAVNAIQDLRRDVAGLGPDLSRKFLAQHEPLYRRLAGWLDEANRPGEAQEVLRLLEIDALRQFSGAELVPAAALALPGSAEMARAQDEAQREVARIGVELAALDAGAPLAAEDRARRERLLDARDAAQKRFDQASREWTGSLARSAPADRIDPLNQRLLSGTQSILRELGEGAVMVSYNPLPDRLLVRVTSGQVALVRSVPVGERRLAELVAGFRRAIARRAPLAELQAQGQELHRLLLAPVEPFLAESRARTLLVASGARLRLLPFAALHDGRGWLAERYAFALYNDVMRDRMRRGAAVEGWVAAFGLTQAQRGFTALPGVRGELAAIERASRLRTEVRLDEQFTRGSLEAALERRPSVLHLASHAVFRPGSQEGSHLLLGDGSTLPLAAFQRLRFDGVDMVVLSACETALGDGGDDGGTEIDGFASVVQLGGARAVMASLWTVPDDNTARLMARLYHHRLAAGVTKSEALRLAQLDVMGIGAAADGADRSAVRPSAAPAAAGAHPYHWAGFVVMGNPG